MKGKSTTYELLDISLLESNFKREAVIDYDNPKFKEAQELAIGSGSKDDKLQVSLEVKITAKVEKKKQYEIKARFLGIFKVYADDKGLSKKAFSEINAPAIIFPFIREHIASISVKSHLKKILLPPINFQAISKNKS